MKSIMIFDNSQSSTSKIILEVPVKDQLELKIVVTFDRTENSSKCW